MKFYRINTKNNGWGLVNLRRVILVDFDVESSEFVFDNLFSIKVNKQEYSVIRSHEFYRLSPSKFSWDWLMAFLAYRLGITILGLKEEFS